MAAARAVSAGQIGGSAKHAPTMQPASTWTPIVTSAVALAETSGPLSFVGVYVIWMGTWPPGRMSARSYENTRFAPMSTVMPPDPLIVKLYEAHGTLPLRPSENGNPARNPRRTCCGGDTTMVLFTLMLLS